MYFGIISFDVFNGKLVLIETQKSFGNGLERVIKYCYWDSTRNRWLPNDLNVNGLNV